MDASNFRIPPTDQPNQAIGRRHVAPSQPIDTYDADYILSPSTYGRTGRLLPYLMIATMPALGLLYTSTLFPYRWLYLGALFLNIILIGAVTLLIIFSTSIGAWRYAKWKRQRQSMYRR